MPKTQQEIMIEKLTVLFPNAKVSIRPFDDNAHLAVHPVIRGDMLIDWHPDNGECPSLETIMAVTDEQVNLKHESERKKARDAEKMNDLTLVALFDAENKKNPNLKFNEYLDELELKRDKLKADGKKDS